MSEPLSGGGVLVPAAACAPKRSVKLSCPDEVSALFSELETSEDDSYALCNVLGSVKRLAYI